MGRVALQRMDNVGIVVESLDAAISFFAELGLELEGRAMIEGDWSGRVTGLRDQRVEIAMMRMPDGHGGIELSRFLRRHLRTLAQASIYGVAAARWSILAGALVRVVACLFPQREGGRPDERLRGGPD